MLAERGIAGPMLAQRHEDGCSGQGSGDNRNFLNGFGGVRRWIVPCFVKAEKAECTA